MNRKVRIIRELAIARIEKLGYNSADFLHAMSNKSLTRVLNRDKYTFDVTTDYTVVEKEELED